MSDPDYFDSVTIEGTFLNTLGEYPEINFEKKNNFELKCVNRNVQRMAEERLPKIALKWMPKQKRARGRPKKTGWKE
jgi:hypothetical protein